MAKKQKDAAVAEHILCSVFGVVDAVVEMYLGRFIRPFVAVHETFYSGLNKVLRKLLDDAPSVPVWFTANFITYFRTLLVIPTLMLLAYRYNLVAAIICIAVDFGDFLDGVVARYWVDINKQKQEAGKDKGPSRSNSPANSDDDSFGMSFVRIQFVFSVIFH